MITTFFADNQIRKFMIQFAAIFQGLQVITGKTADGTTKMINVPIHVGAKDRVVAAITAGNTTNAIFALPIMSCDMLSIEITPERRKGVGMVDRRVTLPVGGVFPDDLEVVHRLMPVPYNLTMELAIYASNTQQMHQILEQILVIFDPLVQIQTTDANFDWTKITSVELTSIQNEQNYPSGTDRRMIMWSLNFLVPIWLSIPADIKNNIVKDIILRYGEYDNLGITELDEDGNLTLFTEAVYGEDHITAATLLQNIDNDNP